MNSTLEAIKFMSENNYVVIHNVINDELGDILYGLGVNYTIEEIDEDHTKFQVD